MRSVVAVVTVVIASACASDSKPDVRISTTTSVQNSDLIDSLRPVFLKSSGMRMSVFSTGSGRALQLLESGESDVAISHAPQAEQQFLARHPEWSYRKFAYNRFIVVGPPDDPAKLAQATDVIDAFRRIADSEARFVSRGDQSGTHEREELFWAAAGRKPEGIRLIVSGRGMAQALRHANEARAYTLTDEPTFSQLRSSLQLLPLVVGDARLLNTYAVIWPANNANGVTFSDWLLSPQGIDQLKRFKVDGQRAYEPWPRDCPHQIPSDIPCRGV
jgi:tungstate transport system substrate-binding protein